MSAIGNFEAVGRTDALRLFLLSSNFKNTSLVLTLLLIKGAFKIIKKDSGAITIQRKDFTILGAPNANSNSLRAYVDKYSSLTTIPQEFHINDQLFRFIFLELCTSFYYANRKNGVLYFLHTYRALERISYALPLIYARKTKDFTKTYSMLQSFFTAIDKTAGELAFLKTALKKLLEPNELRYHFVFSFTYPEKKALQVSLNKFQDTLREVAGIGFELDLEIIPSLELFIDIRNKYFHALSGKDHLNLEELIDPETTFFNFTDHFINILCFIIGKFIEPELIQN